MYSMLIVVTSIVDPRSPPSLYIVSGGESVLRNTVYEYYAYSDVSSLVDLDLLLDFMLGLGEKESLVTPFISPLFILMSPFSCSVFPKDSVIVGIYVGACYLNILLLCNIWYVYVPVCIIYNGYTSFWCAFSALLHAGRILKLKRFYQFLITCL